ncbi:MAG: peptidase S8 [Deltaproteobacteria bacterium]|nr:peptidase S8 [Deltaproteobacteria bacterium]
MRSIGSFPTIVTTRPGAWPLGLLGFDLLLAAALLLPPAAAAAQGRAGGYPGLVVARAELFDEDEILVDFHDEVLPEQVAELARRHGLTLALNSIHSAAEVLTRAVLPAGMRPEEVVRRLARDPLIEHVEREALHYAMLVPNDPRYAAQWHMRQIGMESAWNLARGHRVVVAVIDTGVSRVPDLAGVDWVAGYDFVDDDEDPADEMGHGTHVAGTIAQRTNNGLGVSGVAFEARIMPLRVLDARGMGKTGDIADAIRFAADHGAQVINMSLGGGARSAILADAVAYARRRGVVVVAAAGNSSEPRVSFPAAYAGVLGVAALDAQGEPTFYSNFGQGIDLAAPGGDTTVDRNRDGFPDGVMQNTIVPGKPREDDYPLLMGTSMASPHVAGAAALLVGEGVTDPSWVESLLQQTALPQGSRSGWSERYGHGRIDPRAALIRARLLRGPGPLLLALFLAWLLLRRLTRTDLLGQRPATGPLFWAALLMGSSGLFFLPWLTGWPHPLLGLLSEPLSSLGLVLGGPGWHLTPLLGSALLPLAASVLLSGHGTGVRLAAGLAVGFAGWLLWSTVLGQADLLWLPGRLLDRLWLAGNGLLALALAWLALKRS